MFSKYFIDRAYKDAKVKTLPGEKLHVKDAGASSRLPCVAADGRLRAWSLAWAPSRFVPLGKASRTSAAVYRQLCFRGYLMGPENKKVS